MLDDPAADRQPKSGGLRLAGQRVADLAKILEDRFNVGVRDAGAVVLHEAQRRGIGRQFVRRVVAAARRIGGEFGRAPLGPNEAPDQDQDFLARRAAAPPARAAGGGLEDVDEQQHLRMVCAALAAANALAHIGHALGGFERLDGLLRLDGMVACVDDYEDHAEVLDGASKTIIRALGERGVTIWEQDKISGNDSENQHGQQRRKDAPGAALVESDDREPTLVKVLEQDARDQIS